MATKGANIPISVDESDAVTGLKKIETATGNVSDTLDDLGANSKGTAREVGASFESMSDDAKDAGKHIDTGISGGAQDAEKGVDKYVRQINTDLGKIKDSASSAGDDISSNVTRGADEASDGVHEFKDEAAGTATEVAASFDGSAQSIAGGFQELAANAFAGFGPAGAAAGIAAAAGIGLVTSSMEKAKEKAQETAEEVAGIASEMIDLGSTDLDAERVDQALQDLAGSAKDGKNSLKEIQDQATAAGIDYSDYARGVSGDSAALERSYGEVYDALSVLEQGYKDTLDAQGNITGATGKFEDAFGRRRDALKEVADEIVSHNAILGQGRDAYDAYKAATDGGTTSLDAQKDSIDILTGVQEGYAAALGSMTEPADLYAQAMDKVKDHAEAAAEAAGKTPEQIAQAGEDAKASLSDVLDELAEEVQKRKDFEANLKNLASRGFGALAQQLIAKGPEAAGAVTDLLAKGTDAQVQQYATDTGTLLGQNLGKGTAIGVQGQQSGLQGAVNTTVAGINVPGLTIPLRVEATVIETKIRKNNDGSYSTLVNGVRVGRNMV